jgi:class 3 adenylate cyclase/tetratricopeptide (TPR) repeat protein
VSVLFADLVGFTTLAADRDSEAVRDLLTRYFDAAREIVERYGGTIEKFIGDAVMAVWGTPTAREDDAERAVRTALDLVNAVRDLDSGADGRGLEARAAVLTGEATVTLGATNQGMVAGDLVNTASRLQSVAPPGTVLVNEATHRTSNQAIAYEEAGEQILRGKAAPVPAWRAMRVVAKRGGEGRSEGLEAPFVGRDDELRLLKDFFHATTRERRARLISVTGQGGIGKSRLAWEFLKYVDGLLETVYWHQGRSPAYGEGITFWALGEMVRRRAGLVENDDEPTTRARIRASLEEFVQDEADRRRIEPALLFLLGFGEAPAGGREELFAAWRTFFERIATVATTALVFEDLQWADQGLLDFIDHLLEWSTGYPLYVVTLARPELLERRPDWGAGRRNFVALSLQPLGEPAMRQLLGGLVPGLPETAVRSILERAGGVPLYAVETVRMLVAEGRLERVGEAYRPTADLTTLAVPESLQALIAARLDALPPVDRALLQDGAVLGQTFPLPALAALNGEPAEILEPRLRGLARREILAVDTDPRSPERGQWGFTQALIREVAYATLSKKERRARHLAAARYFESLGDEEVGVLATHYVDAYLASPPGPEADSVATQARIALRAAADRASALGSHEQAVAYLARALDVTTVASERGEVLERIGAERFLGGSFVAAEAAFRDAIEAHRGADDRRGIVRATTSLGQSITSRFEPLASLTELEGVLPEAEALGDPELLVRLNGQIARALTFDDRAEAALERADRALTVGERLGMVGTVADVLVTKGIALANMGRLREGIALLEGAEHLAESIGQNTTVSRAIVNLSAHLPLVDPHAALEVGRRGADLSRRLGLRHTMAIVTGNCVEAAVPIGDFGWTLAAMDELLAMDLSPTSRAAMLGEAIIAHCLLGLPHDDELAELRAIIDAGEPGQEATILLAELWEAASRGDYALVRDRAVEIAEVSLGNAPHSLALAARHAVLDRNPANIRETLDRIAAIGVRGPTLDAQVQVAQAGLDALEGRWSAALTAFQAVTRWLSDQRLHFDESVAWMAVLATAPAGDPAAVAAERDARRLLAAIPSAPYLAQLDRLVERRASDDAATGRASAGVHAAADA